MRQGRKVESILPTSLLSHSLNKLKLCINEQRLKRNMSQRDGFTGGFLAGAAFGALVGGIVGILVTAQKDNEDEAQEQSLINSSLSKVRAIKGRRNQLQTEESIEAARRSLEDKIAQLNTAIDDVRQQLGTVNGNATEINREL